MAVKFYLEKRLTKQGESPIRCAISIRGNRFVTTVGHNISPMYWDSDKQQVIRSHKGKPVTNHKGEGAKVINSRLKEIDSYFHEFELTADTAEATRIKDFFNEEFSSKYKESSRNRLTEILGEHEATPFFVRLDEFTAEMGDRNEWTKATFAKFTALKRHLMEFSPTVDFASLNEKGLTMFVDFLRNNLNMRNSTIGKQLGFLKWFLRWATQKGYNQETAFQQFSPKLKATEKKVVFLEWGELMRVYNFEFPDIGTKLRLTDMNGNEYEKTTTVGKKTLEQVRDVFCFCCFTSLRYSDVANLKRSDVFPDHITITTVKTADTLKIELNKYARAILDKYKDTEQPFNKALPVISNQRMNEYLKELGEVCSLNTPVTVTYYKGNKRIDEVFPKWQMIGTHTGRRTFICNALSKGIAPQVVMKWTGHSDYKAMKPYIDILDNAKAEAMKLFDS